MNATEGPAPIYREGAGPTILSATGPTGTGHVRQSTTGPGGWASAKTRGVCVRAETQVTPIPRTSVLHTALGKKVNAIQHPAVKLRLRACACACVHAHVHEPCVCSRDYARSREIAGDRGRSHTGHNPIAERVVHATEISMPPGLVTNRRNSRVR